MDASQDLYTIVRTGIPHRWGWVDTLMSNYPYSVRLNSHTIHVVNTIKQGKRVIREELAKSVTVHAVYADGTPWLPDLRNSPEVRT